MMGKIEIRPMTIAKTTPGSPAEIAELLTEAHRQAKAGELAKAAATYQKILQPAPRQLRSELLPGQFAPGRGAA